MRKLGLLGWGAAVGLGLIVEGGPRLAVAAPGVPGAPPGPPGPPGPPSVARPPTAEPLPENVNKRQRRYADREAANPQSAEFRGGDNVAIYLSGGAVTVVLLVVLIVVLL